MAPPAAGRRAAQWAAHPWLPLTRGDVWVHRGAVVVLQLDTHPPRHHPVAWVALHLCCGGGGGDGLRADGRQAYGYSKRSRAKGQRCCCRRRRRSPHLRLRLQLEAVGDALDYLKRVGRLACCSGEQGGGGRAEQPQRTGRGRGPHCNSRQAPSYLAPWGCNAPAPPSSGCPGSLGRL